MGSPWSDLKTQFLPREEMQDMEHQYPSAEPSKGSPIPPRRVERTIDMEAMAYISGRSLNSSGSPGNSSIGRMSFLHVWRSVALSLYGWKT